MKEEIINRVANSKLITFDLESLYPKGKRLQLDLSSWLQEGLILREKEFRGHLTNLDISLYKDTYTAIYCSTDAIVPAWAFMLVSIAVNRVAKKVVKGSVKDLETVVFSEIIQTLDLSYCKGKSVIIKGCSNLPIPDNAYLLLAQKLQPIAKSISYGEACSSVPLFKK